MAYYLYFDKSRMDADEGFPGVPHASLSKEEYDGLPAYLQAAVDGHPAYRKSAPPQAKDEAADPVSMPAKGKE
jgi:hypothetical protein